MLKDFKAFVLAKEFHWACRQLRMAKYLHDQLLRASSSIVLNLAEGSAKRTATDQRRFYNNALGSARECEAILALERIEKSDLVNKLDQLTAMVFTLARPQLKPTPTPTQTQNPNSKPPTRTEVVDPN
jgi:four helix bundle protein